MDSPEERAEGQTPAEAAPAAEPKNHRQELKREVIDFVKLVAWFLVIFLVLRTYVIEAYEVQGPSMIPTLETNERILVLKLPHELSQIGWLPDFEAISPGDVIVFDSPDNKDKRYVKRVIAIGPAGEKGKTVSANSGGGEEAGPSARVHVVFDRGDVYVNERRIQEDYLSPEARRTGDKQDLEIGPGELYVLGDNRPVSKDSRSFRAIEDKAIIGRAVLRFWPPSKFSLIR